MERICEEHFKKLELLCRICAGRLTPLSKKRTARPCKKYSDRLNHVYGIDVSSDNSFHPQFFCATCYNRTFTHKQRKMHGTIKGDKFDNVWEVKQCDNDCWVCIQFKTQSKGGRPKKYKQKKADNDERSNLGLEIMEHGACEANNISTLMMEVESNPQKPFSVIETNELRKKGLLKTGDLKTEPNTGHLEIIDLIEKPIIGTQGVTRFENHEKQSGSLHMKIHKGIKPYECVECGKTFTQLGGLQSHMRMHRGVKPHQCIVCEKTFTHSSSLQDHMNIHTGMMPYECVECGERFTHSKSMHRHMKIHTGMKPHQCIVCEKTFIQSGALREHMQVHTGMKPYACVECGKQFTQSSCVQRHMNIHCGIKPYKCVECGKTFTYSGSVKGHMRIHSRIRPYECIICGKKFTQTGNLQTHMRIHSGVKPYECVECGKKFTQAGSLQSHMRIHSGIKPYKCVECEKKFTHSCNLRLHMNNHCGIKPKNMLNVG